MSIVVIKIVIVSTLPSVYLSVLSYYLLIKVFRTHPVEHKIIAHFQKSAELGRVWVRAQLWDHLEALLHLFSTLCALRWPNTVFKCLCFDASFLQESRLITEVFILA